MLAREFIVTVLGLAIDVTPQYGNKQSFALITYNTGRQVIQAPSNLQKKMTPSDVNRTLWHEVGHFFDEARTRRIGRSLLFSSGKYSSPFTDLLKKHQKWIQRNRKEADLGIDITHNKKKYTLEQALNADWATEANKAEYRDLKRQQMYDYQEYLNLGTEIFADGFTEYVLDRSGMRKEAPELIRLYDSVFRDSRLKGY